MRDGSQLLPDAARRWGGYALLFQLLGPGDAGTGSTGRYRLLVPEAHVTAALPAAVIAPACNFATPQLISVVPFPSSTVSLFILLDIFQVFFHLFALHFHLAACDIHSFVYH